MNLLRLSKNQKNVCVKWQKTKDDTTDEKRKKPCDQMHFCPFSSKDLDQHLLLSLV
jgi:hypothetical protein